MKRKVWLVWSGQNGFDNVEGIFYLKSDALKLLKQLVCEKAIKSEMSESEYKESRDIADDHVSFIKDDVLYVFWLAQEDVQ